MYSGGGYGSGSSFSIQDYAPVDPMSGIPGFGSPPTQSQSTQQPLQQGGAPPANAPAPPTNRNTQPGTSAAGVNLNKSQSTSGRSGNSAKIDTGVRHISTEEMRREYQRAAPYVPTPINETFSGAGSSTAQQSSSTSQQRLAPTSTGQSTSSHKVAANMSRANQQEMRVEQQNTQFVQSPSIVMQGHHRGNPHGQMPPTLDAQAIPGRDAQIENGVSLSSQRQDVSKNSSQSSSNHSQSVSQKQPVQGQPAQNNPPNTQRMPQQSHVCSTNVPPGWRGQHTQRPPGHGAPNMEQRPIPPPIQTLQANPHIAIFMPGDFRFHTHIVYNNAVLTIMDFVKHMEANPGNLNPAVIMQTRIRLPPHHPLHIPREALQQRPPVPSYEGRPPMQSNVILQRQAHQGPHLLPGPGNTMGVQMLPGQPITSRAPPSVPMLQNVPGSQPQTAHQHGHPNHQFMPQPIPPGRPALPPHFLQQSYPMPSNVNMRHTGLTSEQCIQFMQEHHALQQNHQQQQQRQQHQQQNQSCVRLPLPAQSQQQPLQQQQEQLQPRPPPRPDQGVLTRLIQENLPPGVRMGISADEPPPPCSYTPMPQLSNSSSSHAEPSQSVDVKPVLPQPQKQLKKKKKPEIITLDDDEPRRIIVKQEVPDEAVSSSSEVVSKKPSTSTHSGGRSTIKQESTEGSSKDENDQRDKTGRQEQPNQVVTPKTSIKQEAENGKNKNEKEKNDMQRDFEKMQRQMEEQKKELERKLEIEMEKFKREYSRESAIKMDEKIKEEAAKMVAKLMNHQANVIPENVGTKFTVQESQVSTSQTNPARASRSRSSSDDSNTLRVRRKNKVIVVSEGEDEDDKNFPQFENPAQWSKEPNETSASDRNQKRNADSDDGMSVARKKTRRNQAEESTDDEESSVSSSSDDWEGDRYLPSDEEEDDLDDFVVDDDAPLDYDDEYFEEEKKAKDRQKRAKHKRSSRSRETPKRKSKSSSKEPSASKTRAGHVDIRKRSSEAGPSTPLKPKTREEKEKERRQKICRTREENREKARLAGLEQMNNCWKVTRRSGPSDYDPLSETLRFTINEFHEASKKDVRKASQDSQRTKEQPTSSNKRLTPTTSRALEDEGVHVPAKRMAHSNSVPGPSRSRPIVSPSPTSRNRPNQTDMLDKRYKEAEEKRKRDRAEYEKLKSKKHLTEEERFKLKRLHTSLTGSGQMSRPTTSTPSTSSAMKVTIKQEIDTSPIKKKPPPPTPSILDPSKGRTFLMKRKQGIKQIHDTLLERDMVTNAAEEAQKIELQIVESHQKEDKYKIALMHKVVALRKENPSGILEVNKNAVSHQQILAGPTKENCTVAKGKKTQIRYELMPMEKLYQLLLPFKLTDSELETNAYPLFKKNSRTVTIAETPYTVNKKMFLDDYDLTRTCSRCNKEYRLKSDGTMIREKDICRYHNRGVAKNGKRDTFRKRYPCCNEEYNLAPGCKFSDVHVFDQLFKKELSAFVATPPPSSPNDPRSTKAYALDCEMVYTVSGPALARLTIVDMYLIKQLDIIIKPPTEVLDPNTEFSGLTMEQIESATETMQTCHKKLFEFANSETILIGHSLESDLKAMRIVHKNVIDTAILFRSTGDFKVALRNLSSKLLGKNIQGNNEEAVGHDSLEDASACVDLVLYGLKNPDAIAIRNSS